MKPVRLTDFRALSLLCGFLVSVLSSVSVSAAPSPAAISAFNTYIGAVESRLAQQHISLSAFLVPVASIPQSDMRQRNGELLIEKLAPASELSLPGAMLHHWRGAGFVSGARAADFVRLMQDFNSYPQRFSPQVQKAKVLSQQGDRFQVLLRVRQQHVITVVMDTAYDITFARLDEKHGYSISRSTRISEIESPGTKAERALGPDEEHGFLWRLNTYWSYQERDGGLYIEIESVSLTRSIPVGLAWAVGPFVESIPRESLEFTLRSTCNALRR
jgi:hypothetical protein